MCFPILLKTFISICIFFNQPNINCIKAMDICVDRHRDISICEDEVFHRMLASEYYSDNRCGWK